MINPETPTFMRPSMKEMRLNFRALELVSFLAAVTERCDSLPALATTCSGGTAFKLRESCRRG